MEGEDITEEGRVGRGKGWKVKMEERKERRKRVDDEEGQDIYLDTDVKVA